MPLEIKGFFLKDLFNFLVWNISNTKAESIHLNF